MIDEVSHRDEEAGCPLGYSTFQQLSFALGQATEIVQKPPHTCIRNPRQSPEARLFLGLKLPLKESICYGGYRHRISPMSCRQPDFVYEQARGRGTPVLIRDK